jgi:hypothetical protein
MVEPNDGVERLAAMFADSFRHWNIEIPAEHLANRTRGKIVVRGWAIWYLFGRDEQSEYVDYYASHRMTSDRHVRLREDGMVEHLAALPEMRLISSDAEEDARLAAQFRAKCRAIADMLRAKGFFIEGDEPGAVQMNMLIRSGELDMDAARRAHHQGGQSAGDVSSESPSQ